MYDEVAFTRAMGKHPADDTLRLIFADWLEERGDPRGELIRVLHTLTQSDDVPGRIKLESRLRNLLAAGVHPVGPFWSNAIGMKFTWVPAGTFLMGSPETEEGRDNNETQHKVILTKGLWVAVHAVTQASWRAVMGNNPSHHRGDDLPVEQVSWEEAVEFLRKLCEREGRPYRLPTEAEWEFACRAGTTTPFYFGDVISTDKANYNGDFLYGNGKKGVYRGKTTPVGGFPANAWALYDMHGNVCEWCQDWYGEYAAGSAVDPQGPPEGERRVLRGGSYGNQPSSGRSAGNRSWLEPMKRCFNVGFRAVRSFL